MGRPLFRITIDYKESCYADWAQSTSALPHGAPELRHALAAAARRHPPPAVAEGVGRPFIQTRIIYTCVYIYIYMYYNVYMHVYTNIMFMCMLILIDYMLI